MSNTDCHTPTPWKVTEEYHEYGNIAVTSDSIVVPLAYLQGEDAESRANAAFIVQAVNSHEQLVSALRGICELIDEHKQLATGKTNGDWCRAIERAEAALSKLEGNSKGGAR